MDEKITKERLVIYLEQYQEFKSKYDELREKYYKCLRAGSIFDSHDSICFESAKTNLIAISPSSLASSFFRSDSPRFASRMIFSNFSLNPFPGALSI